mgnify:CR=1 FL=1
MAMNKKGKVAFDTALKAVHVARALNWTDPVERDVLPPLNGTTTGFLINAMSSQPSVLYAMSSSVSHATSLDEFPKKTTTQGCRWLYSTELLALKALRHELEKKYAESLARIDMRIEKAKLNSL